MSTVDPQYGNPPETGDESGVAPGEPPPEHHRSRWVWVSAVLAVIAVGLLVWGLTTQSDLNSSKDDVDDLQTQVSNESTESEAAKDVAGDLAQDLGATNEDLSATQEDLAQAEQSQATAESDAAAAKQDADQADDATAKAEAEAKEAKAEAEAATSKTQIASECAKAYTGAFGKLFEGESVKAQAEVVRKELESISAQCQKALSGA